MIDIKILEKNKEHFIESFKNRGIVLNKEIDKVIEMNKNYIELISKESEVRHQLNKISKEISTSSEKDLLKNEASILSKNAKEISSKISLIKKEMEEIVSYFPQLPLSDVPVGKDEKDNVVLKEYGEIKAKDSLPHWEILEKKKIILENEASNISGARHVFYNDKGVKLIKAIEKFMLDLHLKNGYKVIEPSVIVNEKSLFNTGQLPKFKEDLYKLENGQYLIPTAEVPLTNLADNKIFKKDELPIKITGSTSCFRKEAGSAGKDTRGLTRLHQFRKVELVKFGLKSEEENDFNEMLFQASKVLDLLEIPYRHLLLCTGDMSFGSQKTIDIEVWMPGQKKWTEISSVSSIGDFQSRRMMARVDVGGKKELINTYNGSGLAIGRTLAAILENYYDNLNDEVIIPESLKKYLDFDKF